MSDIVKNSATPPPDGLIKKYGYHVILIFLAIIFYLPYLWHAQPSLLDDPWYFYMAKNLNIFDIQSILTAHGGRLIPFTIIFYYFNYQLAHFDFFWVISLRLVELGAIILLIYYLVKRFVDERLAFWCAAVILFSAPMVTNFYELETQDHISLLLILIFSLVYFKLTNPSFENQNKLKRVGYGAISFIVLLCFLLTKETNIFITAVFAVLFGLDWFCKQVRRIKLLHLFYFIVCALFAMIFFIYSGQIKGGSMGYGPSNILPAIWGYAKILNLSWFFIIYALVLFTFRVKKDFGYALTDNRWQLFFLLMAVFSFCIYLPWSSVADRYLLMPFVFIALLAFINFNLIVKKYVWFIVVGLAVAGNLYFSVFHFVRFYGARQSDARLMNYLVKNASQYDQVCLPLSVGSNETIIQMDIWLNKINKLNKKVCTLSSLTSGFFTGEDKLLDNSGILYGDRVVITSSTLVIQKETTGVVDYPLDAKYIFQPSEHLNFHIYNIHPTRGFEIKKFDWIVGTVKKLNI